MFRVITTTSDGTRALVAEPAPIGLDGDTPPPGAGTAYPSLTAVMHTAALNHWGDPAHWGDTAALRALDVVGPDGEAVARAARPDAARGWAWEVLSTVPQYTVLFEPGPDGEVCKIVAAPDPRAAVAAARHFAGRDAGDGGKPGAVARVLEWPACSRCPGPAALHTTDGDATPLCRSCAWNLYGTSATVRYNTRALGAGHLVEVPASGWSHPAARG